MTPEEVARKIELYKEADKRGLLKGKQQQMFREYMLREQNGKGPEGYQGNSTNPMTAILKGATANLSDEIQGGISATYVKLYNMLSGGDNPDMFGESHDKSFKESYEEGRDMTRADQQAFAKANPKTNLALEVAGGLTTGGLGASKVLGTQAIANSHKIIKGATTAALGGAESAVYGFGEGEGMEDSINKAAEQGVTGLIATPVISTAINKIAKPLLTRGANKVRDQFKKTQTMESLKSEATSFYGKSDRSGIKIKKDAFDAFVNKTIADLKAEGINVKKKTRQPSERGIVSSIRRMQETAEPTYKDLMAMKSLLNNAKKNKQDGSVADAAYTVSDKIDEFMANLKPSQLSAGDATDLGQNLKEAQSYWARHQQSTTLAEIADQARRSPATVYSGNYDEAMNSKINSLIDSPSKRRGMPKEIVSKLHDMVIGDNVKGLSRGAAQVAPGAATARGPGPAVGVAMGVATGVGATGDARGAIAGLIPPALGFLFKKIANKITADEFKHIQNLVINKGQPGLEETIEALYGKYKGGAAANLAATSASSLHDLVME